MKYNLRGTMDADGRASVPGLARGIEILGLLSPSEGMELRELAAKTGFPKASILRMLSTLQACSCVSRESDGRYFAAKILLPASEKKMSFGELRRAEMVAVARDIGSTVEWFEPSPDGLVLVEREEAPLGEVVVKARRGFVRCWGDELDSVACIGYAFCKNAPPPAKGMWAYDGKGKRKELTKKKIVSSIDLARRRRCFKDFNFNENGVSRAAAPCVVSVGLVGILSAASVHRHFGRPDFKGIEERLRRAVLKLQEKAGEKN